jgi:hypothetical protein
MEYGFTQFWRVSQFRILNERGEKSKRGKARQQNDAFKSRTHDQTIKDIRELRTWDWAIGVDCVSKTLT